MKSTGIVRKIDSLGRIVLPMELRRTLQIELNDPLEIFVDGSQIILQKYLPGCSICSETGGNIPDFNGIRICSACFKKIEAKMRNVETDG